MFTVNGTPMFTDNKQHDDYAQIDHFDFSLRYYYPLLSLPETHHHIIITFFIYYIL